MGLGTREVKRVDIQVVREWGEEWRRRAEAKASNSWGWLLLAMMDFDGLDVVVAVSMSNAFLFSLNYGDIATLLNQDGRLRKESKNLCGGRGDGEDNPHIINAKRIRM